MNNLYILITGGGTGIGKEIALEMDRLGNNVIICGRRLKKLKEVCSNTKIKFHKCDVSKEKDILNLKKFVSEIFPKIDVLLNAAAVLGPIGRFDTLSSKLWIKSFNINFHGTYFTSKIFLSMLKKSNVKKIINFSGGGAFGDFKNYSSYACTKSAVVRLSENMAVELLDLGISVNCIAPGFVATQIHNDTLKLGPERAGKKYYDETITKLKNGSVPIKTVINCLKYLMSDKSNILNGKTISASFDKWDTKTFNDNLDLIQESELYTMRRINLRNFDENHELNKKLS